MPWFRVDDTLPFHTKVVTAGNASMGLWLRAGAWSMQQLTDGFVPAVIARQLGTRAEARKLVEVGLWIDKDDGYQFHQWHPRQPTRLQVLAERDSASERQRAARERRKKEREA